MEPHDNEQAGATRSRTRADSGRILIVGGDADFRAALTGVLNRRHHRSTHVNRLDEARSAVGQHQYDLVLLNPSLPDGDGFDLAQHLQGACPATRTIVFSDTRSFRLAERALRCGALDFVRTPMNLEDFGDRVDSALARTMSERRREQRVRRLLRICRELSSAREEITEQVDALCNDLAAAYRDLTEQLGDVAMASEFRTLLRQELDIEDLLRTTLEYTLTKTGPTNAAVFLPDDDQMYSLGAYVNYDCPRETIDRLLGHLGHAICPQMADEPELVAFDDADQFAEWIGVDGGLLADAQVIAFSCIHEGECLAVVILFRSRTAPFEAHLAGTLDILRSIFAEQLSQVVRVHHRANPSWPREPEPDGFDLDDGYGFDLAA